MELKIFLSKLKDKVKVIVVEKSEIIVIIQMDFCDYGLLLMLILE